MDLFSLISFILTIVGLVFAILWFYPRISVSVGAFPNKKKILSTKFVVSNDGNVSITNIIYAASVRRLKTSDGLTMIGDENFKGRIIEPNSSQNKTVLKMTPGEKNTVQFPENFIVDNVIEADVAIVIRFQILFLKWEKLFRFSTECNSEGEYFWNPQPLSK